MFRGTIKGIKMLKIFNKFIAFLAISSGTLGTLYVEGGNYSLKCPISSIEGRKVIWLLPDMNKAVYKWNRMEWNFDEDKYGFSGSSGDLIVKKVTEEDEGLYVCIVEELVNQTCTYRTSGVHLRLRRNEGREYNPSQGNATRAMIAASAVLVIFCLLCTVYHFRWKKPVDHLPSHKLHKFSVRTDGEENVMSGKEEVEIEGPFSEYSYVNKSFRMNAATSSPDKIYVIPESRLSPKSFRFSGRQSPPKRLGKEEIDGPSDSMGSGPFQGSSEHEHLHRIRSQVRIKRWWLNPVGSPSPSTSIPIPSSHSVIGTGDLDQEDESTLQSNV